MADDPKVNRRRFLAGAAEAGAACVVLGLGWGAVSMRDANARWVPRPPGALLGKDFLAACAHCGQCAAACPYETLKIAGIGDPAPVGTPYFEPEKIPCYMCEDLACVKACPTGALSPELESIRDARMGVAMIDPNACLSWQGLRCEVCFRDCPLSGEAIVLSPHPRELSKHAVFVPEIRPEKCTGCGLCIKSCPTDKPAVRIHDPERTLGEIGRHYRLGWLEADDPKNQRSAPEPDAKPAEEPAPFASGLDYLNQEVLP